MRTISPMIPMKVLDFDSKCQVLGRYAVSTFSCRILLLVLTDGFALARGYNLEA